MIEIVIPILYLLSGIFVYSAVNHLSVGLSRPYDHTHLLFAVLSLLMVPFALFLARTLQAQDLVEFVRALKWNISAGLLFFLLFPWFIALYTGKHLRFLQAVLSLTFAVLFVVNLTQSGSLQYDHLEGLHTLLLPWGESIISGEGHNGPWAYITIAAILATFGYVLYSLGSVYHRDRWGADFAMLLAIGLFTLTSIEGLLVRLSILDFVPIGPFGFLAMVIVMSTALSHETQKRLRKSERKFRWLFEKSPAALVAIDPANGRFVQANSIALNMCGYDAEEFLTKTVADLTFPDYLAETRQLNEQLAKGLTEHVSYEKRYLRKDGSSFPGQTSISVLKDENGKIISIVGSTIDITGQKRIEDTLREQVSFFRTIAENSNDLIAVLDLKGQRLYNSPSYAKLFGDVESIKGTDSFAEIHPDDRDHIKRVFNETVESGTGMQAEFRFVLADGSIRHMESRGGLIRDSQNHAASVVVVSRDITERKLAEEEIFNLAFYDMLTGLPNRRLLNDRLVQAMASSARSSRFGAVISIDLDNFKPLNDLHGHSVGDLLLREAARRISHCVRKVDTVSRYGGDEFVILLSELNVDHAKSTEEAGTVAEKIRVALSEPYLLMFRQDEKEEVTVTHHCTASIGVILFINHANSVDEVLRRADLAMYKAKNGGRNLTHFYN